MYLSELQDFLDRKIPISKEMGGKVIRVDSHELLMSFPLYPNRNHKGTLFGGSTYSGAALASYGLFLWNLRDEGFNSEDIVIGEGTIKYFKPVDHDAEILVHWATEVARRHFFDSLNRKQKARVEITAQVFVRGALCALFTGNFVAKIHSSELNSALFAY